jgi:uncharacterized protein (TIGR02231 family)
MSERPMATEMTLTYFVNTAGWAASYDLKAFKETQNIELKHRAAVYQNTGVDWKEVLLTLSTGNPNQENTRPNLTPQYIAFHTPMAIDGNGYYKNEALKKQNYGAYPAKMPEGKSKEMVTNQQNNGVANSSAPVVTDDMPNFEALADKEGDGVTEFTQVSQNMMRVEYEIKLKYTIESDNKPHNVIIQSKMMPAVYSYSIVPKLDPDAFLMARVTDWEDMNLIPGSARLYFDNSYIGESYINPRNTNDTLQLNLGRDKSIVTTRSKVKDKCKNKSFSDNHISTMVYEIKVRNTKNIPIRLVVEDQMPVTKEPSIKIDYLENSDARFNSETGKLIWDFNLKHKDTKKMTFSYEIKSPKDKAISAL